MKLRLKEIEAICTQEKVQPIPLIYTAFPLLTALVLDPKLATGRFKAAARFLLDGFDELPRVESGQDLICASPVVEATEATYNEPGYAQRVDQVREKIADLMSNAELSYQITFIAIEYWKNGIITEVFTDPVRLASSASPSFTFVGCVLGEYDYKACNPGPELLEYAERVIG